MNILIKNLLEKHRLRMAPRAFDESFYKWMEAVEKELDVFFISCAGLTREEYSALKKLLGKAPPELQLYYSKSTPWDYDIDEFFDRFARIQEACMSRLVKKAAISPDEAKNRIAKSPSLWPISISIHSTTLAFSDEVGRLSVISGNIRGGFGLGRPLAMGLRNYFTMRVINHLAWIETDVTTSSTEVGLQPEILAVGEWPEEDPPRHVLIDCFGLENEKRQEGGKLQERNS